jgi:DNA polymerase (family 10)
VVDNYAIADQFSLLSKLMDIHGENAFKAKSYASAAFTIEKLDVALATYPAEKMARLKGIGDSVAGKVTEILQTGELKALQDLIAKTPQGVLEMMNIKGLGPKKINTIWKEMGIDTIEDLKEACLDNRVAQKKGFGEKTQQKILDAIDFLQHNAGSFLYKQVEDFALALQEKLTLKFPEEQFAITGEFKRQLEVISRLEWVTTATKEALKNFLVNENTAVQADENELLILCAENLLPLHFHTTAGKNFNAKLFETSSSEEFLAAWRNAGLATEGEDEKTMFKNANLSFIPSYLRETAAIIEKARTHSFENIVQPSDIKGLVHSHSNWSDGSYTIEQMAEELIRLGFEYLVISDHSKSAYYANGLSEEKIREQHRYIDELNKRFAPFKIFKSIECDILGDGSLDYDNAVLKSFDLVITSIHSNLDMDEEKAMMRLMGAIANPYTTILGHMTGRLLTRRKGYPVDHKKIIDACVANDVAIEINASPSRLDMDWRWIDYAMSKGLMLSINPDAHSLEEFHYVMYGTLVAQKGGLPPSRNLSSFSLNEFEKFLTERKRVKNL